MYICSLWNVQDRQPEWIGKFVGSVKNRLQDKPFKLIFHYHPKGDACISSCKIIGSPPPDTYLPIEDIDVTY